MPSCLKGHSSMKLSPNNPTNISLKLCEGHFFTFAWGRETKELPNSFCSYIQYASNPQMTSPID